MRVKHLLKSAAHQHKDPLVRLEHVATLDPVAEESAELLGQLARTDPDLHVRVASIDRLTDLAVLRELLDAQGDDAEAVRDAAERRLGTRIESGEVSDVAIRALLDTHAARLATGVASVSPHAEQRQIGLNALDDETGLVTVIQQSRLHDARMAAAERLTRHDTIRVALTACRSRDKVVAKLLQQRLDDEAAAEAERIAVRHAVTSTLDSMQQLARSVWSPQHAGKAQALRERWAALAASDSSGSADAFATADSAVLALLDEHQRTQAAKDQAPGEKTASEAVATTGSETTVSPPAGSAVGDAAQTATGAADSKSSDGTAGTAPVAVVPEPDAESLALADRLQPVEIAGLVAAVDADEGKTDSTLAGALRAHGRAVAVLFDPPYDHARARPASLAARIKRVAALLDTTALVPGLDLSTHRYIVELSAHRDALADRIGKSEQESTDRVKATHRQFAALGGIISEGKWAPANSLLRRLQKKLSAMEPAERKTLDDKLARAEKQLAEMGDWQDFATRPKLDALCVEMEALPAQELSPPKLAKAVRDLQSQWKELGPSRAANELWPRFKTAGDTAYEPCKAWFAQKGEERQAKTEARRAICVRLEGDITLLGRAMPMPVPKKSKAADGESVSPDGAEAATAQATTSASAPSADDSGPAEATNAANAQSASDTNESAEAIDVTPAAHANDLTPAADTADTSDSTESTESADFADATAAVEEPETVGVGPEPDWKAIQRRVGDAKREWSRQRVTDRKPDRKLENRFSSALKPFESALKREYEKNEVAKRELIEKAEALAGGDINQHVANQAKTLLSAWKLVGIMPRRVDQQLWETFNGHLGTIFKHQQAVAREKRRAGFEHVDRARAIAKELRTLARADSVDEAAVQALSDEFHALADFPERDRRGLERDFRSALDATARVQETAGKRRKQAEQEERQRLVELCERLEAAVESPDLNPSGSSETLAEDVGHAWEASETRVNREMAVRLESRRDVALELLASGGQFDFAANEEARRDLLIRMEVAADIETPPEDKSRRMRFQLENLQAGMTSAAVADRRVTLARLEEDWLAAAPASRSVQGALQSRYLKALGR